MHIAGEVFVPDLAGWKRARLPRLPETHFTLPPDWVCEVRAPSNESDDRSERLRIYARERISHAWLVDPARRLFEVLRLEAGRWSFVAAHKNDEIVRAEPFEAIEIELSRLWAEVESAANGQEQ